VESVVSAPSAAIDLSDNTNRWGAPPSALGALRERAPDLAHYPEPYADSLKDAVAAYLGVEAANVSTGCGSDGVLDVAMRAFGKPGDRVAIPEPTFHMPIAFARANGLVPVPLALDGDCQPDVAAILEAAARVVYLCSPNNPLGASCEPQRVAEIARNTGALVIVDEAYAEFAGETVVPLVRELGNVIVVRTLSKAFGLAGARVGYAVGAPEAVAALERVRGPFTVNAAGAAAATSALRDDVDWMRLHATRAVTERDYLTAGLRAVGLDPLPSSANFVLAPLRGAVNVAERLRARGISVRTFTALRPVCAALAATGGSAIRITAGPRAEMDAVLAALDAARTQGRR
jgi:histidinol-phosphate aminotransferase